MIICKHPVPDFFLLKHRVSPAKCFWADLPCFRKASASSRRSSDIRVFLNFYMSLRKHGFISKTGLTYTSRYPFTLEERRGNVDLRSFESGMKSKHFLPMDERLSSPGIFILEKQAPLRILPFVYFSSFELDPKFQERIYSSQHHVFTPALWSLWFRANKDTILFVLLWFHMSLYWEIIHFQNFGSVRATVVRAMN